MTIRFIALVAALAFGCATSPRSPAPAAEVQADIAYLASVKLAGREPGTSGSDSAAVHITRRYRSLEISGAFPLSCHWAPECPSDYFQPFDVGEVRATNIGALIRGTDSILGRQYVVIGAHYDHLGTSPRGALDPQLGIAVRPGADDNASGTAAVLALARRFAERPPRRSLLLVHFDAEEWGLFGSRFFVEQLRSGTIPVVFMLNLDMVGRLRGKPLNVYVAPANNRAEELVDSVASVIALRISSGGADAGRSDIESFARAGIASVGFFTGLHPDYHRVTDRPTRIDVAGIIRVVDLAEVLVRAIADR